ncbi:testis-specific gene 13 protein [Eublepharis macularius]|uniref:Testis-specific gene 13 protein n=1 Tax=Eublepharis macularius TaxID=481883 RepID=A0AA97JU25_EUBMA|nr:testis-specific gene 13 protein [Eublepharis macularius]
MVSHFNLKYEKNYSFRPNLIRYFMPMTDAEFQERLDRHKGEIAVMMRSSEFNQDKTALIVTNNHLPMLVSGQHLITPFHFFSKDLLGETISVLKPHSLPPLSVPQTQLMVPDLRKPGKRMPFRFATPKDFKGEAKFSKVYAERRLLQMYPQLRTRWFPGVESRKTGPFPSIEGWPPRMADQWEPLTLTCLEKVKPTLVAPGDDGFRYGKAPLWVINRSVVPKLAK